MPRGLGSRRDFARKKGERGLLLVGHEKVPHGFGLTGDCSSHPADGAGSLNHGLLLLFLRHGTEAGCSQEEGPKKGFVMGSRIQGVQKILEKCV